MAWNAICSRREDQRPALVQLVNPSCSDRLLLLIRAAPPRWHYGSPGGRVSALGWPSVSICRGEWITVGHHFLLDLIVRLISIL